MGRRMGHRLTARCAMARKYRASPFGRVEVSGVLAWLAWLLIHLMFLVGFRNRVLVLFQWAWSFISYDRGARSSWVRCTATRISLAPNANRARRRSVTPAVRPPRSERRPARRSPLHDST